MSDSLTYEETAKKHFNIKITSEFSDDCIHYFYNILTADGYELFVSTKDPNNIELSKNVFYYDYDLAGELTSVVLNNKESNKIYVARDLVDTAWYDEGLQSVCDELGLH